MKTHHQEAGDGKLGFLLREARPAPALPPRFQEGVWHRIGHPEQARPVVSWVETIASLLLKPRFAFATATALIVVGVLLGSLQGAAQARHTAQQRYVAAVVMPVAP